MQFYNQIARLDIFERTVKCRSTQAFITYLSPHHFVHVIIRCNSTQAFLTRQRCAWAQIYFRVMTVTILLAYNLIFSGSHIEIYFWNILCTNLIFLFLGFNHHYKFYVYKTTIRLKLKWNSVENDRRWWATQVEQANAESGTMLLYLLQLLAEAAGCILTTMKVAGIQITEDA